MMSSRVPGGRPPPDPAGDAPVQIHCPHCRNTVELAGDQPPDEVLCPTCGSSFRLDPGRTVTWSPDGLGRTVGRFVLEVALGSGAFGTVYRARDPGLDRAVAVKVPRPGTLDGPGVRERFLREARSSAQLRHPHIVTVHEVGEHDGVPYLVSDLVEGVTLADRLTADRPGVRPAAELVADVADALQYAHAHGVTHRDVKPSNIMLDADGRPRVMDFGLAKRDAGEVTMTLEGQVLGTPAYMSPEQARGEGHTVDGRSDVYSLGVVLYQLLAGELPFRGNVRMQLHQVLHDEPRPPRKLNDRIPRDLETICLKAMAKEPARRYQSAGELAADLRRWLKGEPVQARPVGQAEKLWRWCRRNPRVARLTAAFMALLLLTAVGSTVAAFSFYSLAGAERAASQAAEQQAQAATEAGKQAQASADAARHELARQYVARGQARVQEGDLFGALPWLVEALKLEQDDPERERMHCIRLGCVLRACPKLVQAWPREIQVLDVGFSPDGRYVLSRATPGSSEDIESKEPITLAWDVTTGAPLPLPRAGDETPSNAVFTPDGTRLVVVDEKGVARFFDLKTSKMVLGPLPGAGEGRIVFSPDGRYLATGQGSVTVWDAATGQALSKPLREAGSGVAQFSPDGRRLLLDDGSVWDWATGRRIFQSPKRHQSETLYPPSLSPDGKRVLVNYSLDEGFGDKGQWRSDVRIFDVETGALVTGALARRSLMIGNVAYSPDGTLVATGGEDGDAWVWEVDTGNPVCPPLRHLMAVLYLTFSPDGRLVLTVSGDQTARVWDIRTGLPASGLLRHNHRLFAGAFSPDGRLAVTAGFSKDEVRVWQWSNAVELESPDPGGTDDVVCSALSPDGTRLATWTRNSGVGCRNLATGQLVGKAFDPGVEAAEMEFVGRALLLLPGAPQSEQERLWGGGGPYVLRRRPAGAPGLWDAEAGRPILPPGRELKGEPIGWFVGDGGWRMLTAQDAEGFQARDLQVIDGSTGEPLGPVIHHRQRIEHGIFSPDGNLVVTLRGFGDYGAAEVWDVKTGKRVIPPLQHGSGVMDAAFSPDGRQLATASSDSTARVWDVADGRPVTPPLAHRYRVEKVRFSADGRLLVTADGRADNNLLALTVWDAATGELILPSVPLPRGTPQVAIDLERNRVIAVDGTQAVRAWSLEPERRPIADLEALAVALAEARLDEGGNLVRLDGGTFHSQEAQLREKFPEYLSRSRDNGLGWHARQAREAGSAGQWFAALWHLSRLLELGQKDAATYAERAAAQVQLGQSEQAVADYESATKLGPERWRDWQELARAHARLGQKEAAARALSQAIDHGAEDHQVWYELAQLQVDAGNRDDYRKTCAEMLRRFRPGPDAEAETVYAVALTCSLQEGAATDLRDAVAAMRRVAEQDGGARYLGGLGGLLVRTGDAEGAVKALEDGIAVQGKEGDPWLWLYLALAHARLGHKDEAGRWLEKSAAWLDGPVGKARSWNDRLHLELLRREATAKIGRGPPP
jgi:WD40 repeat protein/tetratricopeptide (TPR) repeat protein